MGTKQNALVVGAGLSGSTVARELAERGINTLVIDQRNHIAGNCYDVWIGTIRKHIYGSHIFHTDNEAVFSWLSRFTNWVEYRHIVKAYYNNQFLTFPPDDETERILGDKLFDVLYRPYTKKMWQTDIDNSVLARVSNNKTGYYFKNKYQFMPKDGYTEMIKNILDHKNIKIELNTPFDKSMERHFDYVFNCMSIDSYYDYCFGRLDYRSIRFYDVNKIDFDMPAPVVNFTDDGKYTRVIRWELFPEHGKGELYTYEEPCHYADNHDERYYPVKDKAGNNEMLYKRYKQIKNDKVRFIGRCGMYVYIDMDMAVSNSLAIIRKL